MVVNVNSKAPEFKAKAFYENEVKDVSLNDYSGKWIVLLFYPKDFTFVCPTELGDIADRYDELQELGVEVLSVSTDTPEVHKAWHDASDTIKKIKFPMVADPTGKICKAYGTYMEDEGISLRGTFLIDPDGSIKTIEIHDNDIGRSGEELMRKIAAAQYVRDNPGKVCPVKWKKGEETLKPGLDLVGKI